MHTNAMPVRAFRLITSKQSLSKRHCHTVAWRRLRAALRGIVVSQAGRLPGHGEAVSMECATVPTSAAQITHTPPMYRGDAKLSAEPATDPAREASV